MDWMANFFVPLIEIVFIIGIVGGLMYIVGRALYFTWKTNIKYFLQYSILRKGYEPETVKIMVSYVDKGFDPNRFKMQMLLENYTMDEARELTWIYRNVYKELKGGIIKHGSKKHERLNQ